VISGGPPVTVPNLTGQTISAARTTLTGLGLTVASGLCQNTENVSSQSPVAATRVSKGDTVSLSCSRCTTTTGCIEIKTLVRSDLLLRTN
jgi:beta-lactam-binding protein with PASTA domain